MRGMKVVTASARQPAAWQLVFKQIIVLRSPVQLALEQKKNSRREEKCVALSLRLQPSPHASLPMNFRSTNEVELQTLGGI